MRIRRVGQSIPSLFITTIVLLSGLSPAKGELAGGFPNLAPPRLAEYRKSHPTQVVSRAQKVNRYYFLRKGDTPEGVSDLLFGTSERASELVGWVGGRSNWKPGAVLYYSSPDRPSDENVVSFYQARNVELKTYTVRPKETLSSIAQREYGNTQSWRELAWLNKMERPDEVEPGQKIFMLPDRDTMERVASRNEPREDAPGMMAATPAPPNQSADRSTAAGDPSASLSATVDTTRSEQPVKPVGPWTFPGINISSPPGYGADWGVAYLGAGVQNRGRYNTTADGALGAGLGMGNAGKYVGVELSLSVLSFQNADRGGMSLKVHRRLPYDISVAVGRENLARWGGTDVPQSWYGSVSKVFFLTRFANEWFSALTLTGGVGDGRFLSEANVRARTGSINVYGSAAIRIQQPVSFIADWTGQDLNLGLSIAPLRDWGLFINPSVADVTNTAGDGARFLLGVGFGYSFI